MNIIQFDEKKLYVKNYSNLIYVLEQVKTYNYPDCKRLELSLKLVCGCDYISEDSEIQGYVEASNFSEDLQWEFLNQYYLVESTKDCLKDWGYEVIEKLPKIHTIGGK